MDFRLTDEQTLMVDTARSLFARECPSDVVRRVADEPKVGVRAVRPAPARVGGAGRPGPSVDLCLFLVEAGAVVAPGPFLPTAGCFAPLLRAADHPLADDAVAGAVTGTVAVAADPTGGCVPPTSSWSTRSRWWSTDRGSPWSTRRPSRRGRSRRSTWPARCRS